MKRAGKAGEEREVTTTWQGDGGLIFLGGEKGGLGWGRAGGEEGVGKMGQERLVIVGYGAGGGGEDGGVCGGERGGRGGRGGGGGVSYSGEYMLCSGG